MTGITDRLKSITGLLHLEGCTPEQIEEAQNALNIQFPEEYIEYVKEFGCVSFGASEWTGLNINGRLNTVEATKQEIRLNDSFPKGFFVLENLGIDAQVVIVNQKGEVYLLQNDSLRKICNNMSEYLDLCSIAISHNLHRINTDNSF